MSKKGFSLIEMVVVLSIMSIISVSGFSIYRVWQKRSNLELARATVVQSLSEAKQRAIFGSNDSNWGVKYDGASNLIVFSGTAYSARTISFDRIFSVPPGISLTGLDEIIFNKFSGLPLTTPVINTVYEGESLPISVSAQGVFGN